MHIAVDCRCIHSHMGGIGRAALDLVLEMGRRSRGHRITMIIGSGNTEELHVPGVHILPVQAAMIDEPFEQLALPSVLAELRPDVYLNTTFSVPAVKTTRIQVSIVHDVVFEDRPDLVEPGLRSYLCRWSRFAAAHADHLLTVSDHARQRIRAVYGVPESRISRVYNGIGLSCFTPPLDEDIVRVRSKFKLDGPFILYLGSIEVKKGIVELLEAYQGAVKSGHEGILVLAGGISGQSLDLGREVERLRLQNRVRAVGYVNEIEKKALLGACQLFVYPSLYEGFGIPPIEAMALGMPCLVSDQTSLPEIVGDAALVTDVRETPRFTARLLEAASDPEFRRRAAREGPARAREYSWERSAGEILDICEGLGRN